MQSARHLLIKPASGGCNLRCMYCFYRDVSEKRSCASYGLMTEKTQEAMIRKALAAVTRACTFAYQGGEPTLAGLEYYRRASELQKKYGKSGVRVYNAIQTNGYRLDEEWAQFFAENRFLVGLSLDGIRKSHDLYRRAPDGSGTFEEIQKTARLFDRYGVAYNILTVVNAKTALLAREIYTFYQTCGYQYLQFIPCLDPLDEPPGGRAYSLTPALYGQFLCELFDLWYADLMRGRQISIRQFDNYVQMRMGYPPESCGMSGVCGMQDVVEADGGVYPCDFYVLDSYRLGNVNQDSFEDLDRRRHDLRFMEESLEQDEKCHTCPHFVWCRGGCKRYREPRTNGRLGRNVFCESYERFFAYAGRRLDALAARFVRPL